MFVVRNHTHSEPHSAAGFTLVEIMLAMVIFSLASVLIAQIFVNLQKAQQRIHATQVAATDARYMLDVLAREIHSDLIDYSAYCGSDTCAIQTLHTESDGTPTGLDSLHLITAKGEKLSFTKGTCGTIDCVMISRNGSTASPITSPNLQIDSLYFYLVPFSNPFADTVAPCSTPTSGSCTPDVQPQVTVVMSVTSISPHPEDSVSLYLQTTAAARTYKR